MEGNSIGQPQLAGQRLYGAAERILANRIQSKLATRSLKRCQGAQQSWLVLDMIETCKVNETSWLARVATVADRCTRRPLAKIDTQRNALRGHTQC